MTWVGILILIVCIWLAFKVVDERARPLAEQVRGEGDGLHAGIFARDVSGHATPSPLRAGRA